MSEREVPSMNLDDYYTLPELGCHTTFARNVRHVDVRAVWHVSRVVSDMH